MTAEPIPEMRPGILLVSLVFAPDGVSTAILLTELAVQLHKLGHDLVVVTTTPHYNQDSDALQNQPLHPRWGSLLMQSDCHGIPVYHARVRPKGTRVLSRLLDYLNFHLLGTMAGLRLGGKYDIVLAPSPPLTVGLSAMILAWWRRVPFVYNVQEIYPDIAVELGVLKNRLLIRMLERLERFIYARARVVVVISEKFRQRLLAKGVPGQKLTVIPNFVDVDEVQPGERYNAFSRQQGLDNVFVVQYAGNIGLTQDFETIVAVAQLLKNIPEIYFLIAGDGARRAWLVQQINDLGLRNIRWLPYQPRSTMPLLYAASDICLVPLRRSMARDTFPSKIYTIMAAGRPAIVSADPDSDLAAVIGQTGCGITVPPGDPSALANAIRSLCSGRDVLKEMGRRGREFVVQYHSPQAVARQYHNLMMSLARNRTGGI